MGTARYETGGTGSQTAGLAFGGYITTRSAATEEYSGYTWATGGNLNTARNGVGGAGTQTAGLAFGGYTDPGVVGSTELYNGSTWTNNPTS